MCLLVLSTSEKSNIHSDENILSILLIARPAGVHFNHCVITLTLKVSNPFSFTCLVEYSMFLLILFSFDFRTTIQTSALLILLTILVTVLLINQKTTMYMPHIDIDQPPTASDINISESYRSRGILAGRTKLNYMDLEERLNRNKNEARHIAFLKVHKAASSTLQNILFRFGLSRKLSFVLPFKGHYISKAAETYSILLPPYNNWDKKYDILCNHVVFNKHKFESLMYEDTIYLAIVRDPFNRFISAVNYYTHIYPNQYLTKRNDVEIHRKLIREPESSEPYDIRQSRTYNRMATDFGLPVFTVREVQKLDDERIEEFVAGLLETFHFVLIVEKYDESLVMMKRYLKWSMKDIVYIKRNDFGSMYSGKNILTEMNITEGEKRMFQHENRVDYAIYERFLERFTEQMSRAEDLNEEVKEFRRNLELTKAFCLLDNTRSLAIFPETRYNSEIRLYRNDCELMVLDELPFCKKLVDNHKKHCNIPETMKTCPKVCNKS